MSKILEICLLLQLKYSLKQLLERKPQAPNCVTWAKAPDTKRRVNIWSNRCCSPSHKYNFNQLVRIFLVNTNVVICHLHPLHPPKKKRKSAWQKSLQWPPPPQDVLVYNNPFFSLVNSSLSRLVFLYKPSILYVPSKHPSSSETGSASFMNHLIRPIRASNLLGWILFLTQWNGNEFHSES